MLVPLSEARRRIDRARFPPPRVVPVPTLAAVGRLAGTALRARGDLPPRPISAMDGYAIRLGDKQSAGPFTIRGASRPSGPLPRRPLRAGEAYYITTGAPIPPGANAVVRVEATAREGDLLRVEGEVRPGQDIMPPGESMRRGDRLLDRGERISPLAVGALVAQRVPAVPTFRLRATVLPIGDELVPAGSRRRGIPDFLGPTVAGLLGFAEVRLGPPIPDDRREVAHALRAAGASADLLLTLGGSSAGDRDVTKAAVADVGGLLFDGVTTNVLKRGAVGTVRRVPVVVLPGQLVSAVTVLHEHGLHVLSRMVGRELRAFEEVALAEDLAVRHRMDSTYLFRLSDGRAVPLPWGVARTTGLLAANAFGVLGRGRTYRAGERVRVQRLGVLA